MTANASHGDPADPAQPKEWLVGCSPERTLVGRRDEAGEILLVKIFEAGSLREARAETELARALAQPGLVRYQAATQDPVTGKPCVVMEFCAGEDLAGHVSARGPLGAVAAARVAAKIAAVLSCMHDRRGHLAPFGVIHRDVKPANVLLNGPAEEPDVTLIDLEHAIARPAPNRCSEPASSVGFRGGTHGYAPAEAYLGVRPDPAFDVFGLGATMHFMLTGTSAFRGHDAETLSRAVRDGARRPELLFGLRPSLARLVDDCLAPDPTNRPTMAEVVARLREILASDQPMGRELDRIWKLARATEFVEANRLLDARDARDTGSTQVRELRQLIARLGRLHSRCGGMPQCDSELSTEPADMQSTAEQIATVLPRMIAFLERFPAHEAARAGCRAMQSASHRLLEAVPPRVSELQQAAAFDDASSLLEMTATAIRAALRTPGPPPTDTAKAQGHLPGQLYRDPLRFLQRTMESVGNVRRAHLKLLARLEQSEARLDLNQAAQVLDEVGAIYTGASRVTAELKDRLHRLDYYLANIARSQSQLRDLEEEMELDDLPWQIEIVEKFQQLCQQRSIVGLDESAVRGKVGCQGLYRAMQDLVQEFPHTDRVARPAMDALDNAMQAMTSRTWELIAGARKKLAATPLPIKPVQSLVNKLDRLRVLRAFVDQQDRSRASLLEDIEWVRMRLDQARAARDQLARGAQESEQRGHLTTALYDMARAMDSLTADDDEDDQGPSAEQLRQQYEELKHKKERLGQAAVDNRRLAAWYDELQGKGDSSFNNRLQALEQRADVLELLLANLDKERALPFAVDLREVQFHLVQEHAAEGERHLVKATTAQARLECAESTLARLRREAPETGGGRAARALDHWVNLVERARQALEQEQEAAARALTLKRRARVISAVAVLFVIGSGLFLYRDAFGGEKPMAHLLESLDKTKLSKHQLRRVGSEVRYPRLPACLELQAFVGRLEDADPDPLGGVVVTAARDLVDELKQLAVAPTDASCLDWVPRVRNQLRVYLDAIKTQEAHIRAAKEGRDVLSKLDEFARVAHLTGVNMAASLPDARARTLENVLRQQHDLGLAAISGKDIDSVLQVLR